MKKLIILRHADRADIPPDKVGNEVMLNDVGIARSKGFASLIDAPPILNIKTSPIGRCVQTAELIAQSVNFNLEDIEQCTKLGDPGFIIADGELAWQHWLDKGHEAVNQYLLSGIDSWQGFYDLDHAVAELFSHIKKLLMQSTYGTHLWVTHDTILATLASRIAGSPLTLQDWPDFLGYLEVILAGDEQVTTRYVRINKTSHSS